MCQIRALTPGYFQNDHEKDALLAISGILHQLMPEFIANRRGSQHVYRQDFQPLQTSFTLASHHIFSSLDVLLCLRTAYFSFFDNMPKMFFYLHFPQDSINRKLRNQPNLHKQSRCCRSTTEHENGIKNTLKVTILNTNTIVS
ncbi:hypothetical protein TNCV_520141 [Trichonephila clavipes]|nr:hypothetical protein TNCV_520141 [Trichonephila clavipes]